MQNAGQFGPGAASAHPPSQFVPSEPSPNGGSTTSSLRQFRKKDVDKSHVEQQQPPKQMSESHVARVAPHNHYPPVSNDVYRYPTHQFPGYSTQVKYSDLAEPSQPNPISTSVIQKPKPKDYMEMCNIQQQHLNNHPQYSPENGQYMPKEPVQGYPTGFKPESHFFPKDQHQYQMQHHPGPHKFNTMMTQNMRKFNPAPSDNPFLNKLSKLHPSMARSIISDHHLQDSQPTYPSMDQRGIYSQQNHRYYSGSIHQPNLYSPNSNYAMATPHPYSNYPSSSCNYPRPSQMGSMTSRYPHMERSMSPGRRGYSESMHMSHMNYHPSMYQKMPSGPNYPPQYRGPEYSQHYQHRRMPQDCFPPQSCRPTQYMQNHHPISGQDMQELSESTVSPSDSLKKFIENWADEEPSAEINPMEVNINLRDKLRDDAPAGTVYMINATDVQYFENNGIPIVTSDNGGFQLTSENYQYLVKNGIVDNTGMVRIIEANKEISIDSSGNQERVVNLQIMEAPKSDCMMANKHLRAGEGLAQNGLSSKSEEESRRVVIHQNAVLNPAINERIPQQQPEDQIPLHQTVVDSLSSTKELVDKNCSPINLDHLEHNLGFSEPEPPETENEKPINPIVTKHSAGLNLCEDLSQNSDDSQYKSPGSKSMPIIDFFGEPPVIDSSEESLKHDETEDEKEAGAKPDVQGNLEPAKNNVLPPSSLGVIVSPEIDATNQNAASSEPETFRQSESTDKDDNVIKEIDDEANSSSPPIENLEATQQRRKRIFSVDDIIHNIGHSVFKESDVVCSAESIIKFMQKEIEFSSLEQLTSQKISEERDGHANSEVPQQPTVKEEMPGDSLIVENNEASPTNRFRNAFRVEGTSVLLQVAGELMEINVNVVNGKKVISVTPLSSDSTAVVDYNDNYEMSANVPDVSDENDRNSMDIEDAHKLAEALKKDDDTDDANVEAASTELKQEEPANDSEMCETTESANESAIAVELLDQSPPMADVVACATTETTDLSSQSTDDSQGDPATLENQDNPADFAHPDTPEVAVPEIIQNSANNKDDISTPKQEDFISIIEDVSEKSRSVDENSETMEENNCVQHEECASATIEEAEAKSGLMVIGDEAAIEETADDKNAVDNLNPQRANETQVPQTDCETLHASDEVLEEAENSSDLMIKEPKIDLEKQDDEPMNDSGTKSELIIADKSLTDTDEGSRSIEQKDVFVNLEDSRPSDSGEEIFVEETQTSLESDVILEVHIDSFVNHVDEEPLEFPLEDEAFIVEPPAHEVIVSDPLEGIGVIEERNCLSDSLEIPLESEPVTTTNESTVIEVSLINKSPAENETGNKELVLPPVKPEVQILSPTSTNIEDPISVPKNNIYLEPRRKYSTDNDVSEYATGTVTTKAAKKLYESDLRVQHDIVSSSKKEEIPKQANKTRKSTTKRSKRLNEKVQTKNEQKEMLRLLVDKRKRREELRQKEALRPKPASEGETQEIDRVEHDEEYVDFKELLRARKLKKLKKLQASNAQNAKELDGLKLKISSENPKSKQKPSTVSSSEKKACKELGHEKTIVKNSGKPNQIKPNVAVALDNKPELSKASPEKCKKRVSFSEEFPSSTSTVVTGSVEPKSAVATGLHPKDPRMKSNAFANHVIVPSVSELIEENGGSVSKKKISLADYVSRKRKATCADGDNKHNKERTEKRHKSGTDSTDTDSNSFSSKESTNVVQTKTLRDVKTAFVINSSDWEDSNSPAPIPTQMKEECLIQDFSGLIKNNSKKPVIDVNELTPLENLPDRKLQEYKDKVDSQLSSLNIQIPKVKPHVSDNKCTKLDLGPYGSPESSSLVARFLNNEKLSQGDMEKIRKIISYKRSMQKNGRSPSKSPAEPASFGLGKSPASTTSTYKSDSSPDPTYEIRNNSRLETDPKEMRLHLKKVNAKRKLLQSVSDDEDSNSVISNQSGNSSNKKNVDYSVFNRLGEDGLPKIIFKRNRTSSLIKEPVVELVKLNLDDLEKVKEKYNVTVRPMM